MWLADGDDSAPRCPSPPLEAGEALCDYYTTDRLDAVEQGIQKLLVTSNEEAPVFFQGLPGSAGLGCPPGEGSLLSLFGQAQLLSVNTFTQTFLQSILSSVESRDPVVASAWMETLLDVIDLLPREILQKDILTLAISKGQISQPITSRLLCCKILGKICRKFDPYIIRKEIVPVVQSLCQDINYEVRAEMGRQLDAVARGIGLEATRSAILPELVELANDEESFVRLISVETVVHMLPMLDDETCRQTIIPLVKKIFENSLRSDDIVLPSMAKHLGKLCHGLSGSLANEYGGWFLLIYQKLANLGRAQESSNRLGQEYISMPDLVPVNDFQERFSDCRQASAFNLPAMVMFVGPQNFCQKLQETFLNLCSDSQVAVRKTVSCSFHEVAKLLGESAHVLLPGLVVLLKDSFIEVLQGFMAHLPETLELVTQEMRLCHNQEENLADLVHALVMCEVVTAHTTNWRLHADFLSSLSCLPRCISSEQIQASFVPLLLNKLKTARPIPCRLAGAYSLLVFLRNTSEASQRIYIIDRIIEDFGCGHSCHKRMLFLQICDLVMELFSKSFFKQHFFQPLLGLAGDHVPNIRLRLCAMLPRLKTLIQVPTDSLLLQQLEDCVRCLMIDETDRDVSAAVRKVINELDEIEVALDPAAAQRSSCVLESIDLVDLGKLDEERKLFGQKYSSKPSIAISKSLPRRAKNPTISRNQPFCTQSWERPKRRSTALPSPSRLIAVTRRTSVKSEGRHMKCRSVASLPSCGSPESPGGGRTQERPKSAIFSNLPSPNSPTNQSRIPRPPSQGSPCRNSPVTVREFGILSKNSRDPSTESIAYQSRNSSRESISSESIKLSIGHKNSQSRNSNKESTSRESKKQSIELKNSKPSTHSDRKSGRDWEATIQCFKESGMQISREFSKQPIRPSGTQELDPQIYRESSTQMSRECDTQVYRESSTQMHRRSGMQMSLESDSQVYRESGTQLTRESGIQISREFTKQMCRESKAILVDESGRESGTQVVREYSAQTSRESNTNLRRNSIESKDRTRGSNVSKSRESSRETSPLPSPDMRRGSIGSKDHSRGSSMTKSRESSRETTPLPSPDIPRRQVTSRIPTPTNRRKSFIETP